MFSLEKTISLLAYPLPELNNPFLPHTIIEDEDMVSNFVVTSLDPPFYCNQFRSLFRMEISPPFGITKYQHGSRVFYDF
jgi:hypothetical protein